VGAVGRPRLALLPEGKIAAQHEPARVREGGGHGDEEGRGGVTARTVGEDEAVPDGLRRLV
jgi:hypothetical protein